MLFPRRTWATRVVGKMGLPIKSREATALIELLIWASKQDTKMMKDVVGLSLSPRDLIVAWSVQMYRNPSAVKQFAKEASLGDAQALKILQDLRTAGLAMAAEFGMHKLLELQTTTAQCLYVDARMRAPIPIQLRVGEDIPKDVYEKYKDQDGRVYAIGLVEDGDERMSFIEKHQWDDLMRKHGMAR